MNNFDSVTKDYTVYSNYIKILNHSNKKTHHL